MVKIDGKEDPGIYIGFPRFIRIKEVKDLCKMVRERIGYDCLLSLLQKPENYEEQGQEQNLEQETEHDSLERFTFTGEFLRRSDGCSAKFDFTLETPGEIRKSRYSGLLLKIGSYNDEEFVEKYHDQLAVFMDDVRHYIEEYSREHFKIG
jgi:hypothetical protein